MEFKKNIILPLLSAGCLLLCLTSCLELSKDNPYEENLYKMKIQLHFPDKISGKVPSGVEVELFNINTGGRFVAASDANGVAEVTVINGMYRVSSSLVLDDVLFNASEDRVKIAGQDRELGLHFLEIVPGELLIKELYVGGCSKMPVEKGDYQSDKYVILHNNSEKVYYLDSLCIGTLSPYNSTAANPWLDKDAFGNTVYQPFLPIIQALWRFGGDGKTFPLQPGEDAVLAFCGAIDHSAIYPESINLNKKDYFVCYNHKFFPNTIYHPVPGDQIRPERHLELVIKMGRANAYSISISSPTFVIFKAKGTSIEEFVSKSDNVIPVPGASIDKVACIPPEWVIDGMEVFNGTSTSNTKRLMPLIDAGAVFQNAFYMGHSMKRKVNEKKTAALGYEVLMDTNNSTHDFEETDRASLWRAPEEGGQK